MNVTIYTKPQCVQCTAVKRTLDRHGVPYTEADATEPHTLERLKAAGHLGAPVTSYLDPATGAIVEFSGFDPVKVDKLVVHYRDSQEEQDQAA